MNKLSILLLVMLMAGCAAQQKVTSDKNMANEPFLIYKTKADYRQNVPIMLNDTKTSIVSYPAPSDLKTESGLRLPTLLSDAYLLDNKGIGKNVAFTAYTYEEYAAMSQAPSLDELMNSIIDQDPLLELYDCKEYLNIKYDLKKVNHLVKKELKHCVKLK
ncbi:MAG: hypothetical protein ACERKD_24505 [Prolixibacteraceae bacterium]